MALQKLWKSIFGGSENRESRGAGTQNAAPSANFQSPVPNESPKQASSPKRGSLLRADKKLLQRVGALGVQSVLQVGVTDSSRTLSMVSSLADIASDGRLKFSAIDQFEMGGNPISLREFHKQLRSVEAVAQLIPMPVQAGLERVSNTTGQVDLILWNTTESSVEDHLGSLTRLSKDETLVFFIDESGSWSETRCSLLANSAKKAA